MLFEIVFKIFGGNGLVTNSKCELVFVLISDLLIPEMKLHTGKYLVFNPKCQVPELKLWSLQILSIVGHSKVDPRCALSSTATIDGTIKYTNSTFNSKNDK